MERFDARIGHAALAWLVIAPPLGYAVALTALAGGPTGDDLTGGRLLLLLGMAHGVPFAALAWMMTSVAAQKKEKILVIEDEADILELMLYNLGREGYRAQGCQYRLADAARPPRCERGVVSVEVDAGKRRLAIRVADPEACRAALSRAMHGGVSGLPALPAPASLSPPRSRLASARSWSLARPRRRTCRSTPRCGARRPRGP